MFSRRFFADDSDDSLEPETDTFEVVEDIETPVDLVRNIKDRGLGSYLKLRKQVEDTSTRPTNDPLEAGELLRVERREREYRESIALVAESTAEKTPDELRDLVGQLSAELTIRRDREKRREKIRMWFMENRFEACGSVDQRRLHHDDGHAPLHDAAIEANADMVRLLLEEGATVNLRNKQEMTPLDIAEWHLAGHCGRPPKCRKAHTQLLYQPLVELLGQYGGRHFACVAHGTDIDNRDEGVLDKDVENVSMFSETSIQTESTVTLTDGHRLPSRAYPKLVR
eukprot:GEMP01038546.1.p1 GENE.GEMP01038546.1~~GEMP01038546.1.p1  ORF type:complete len:283 (+),score=59.07 GEMP01038546.1:314-1162(+)